MSTGISSPLLSVPHDVTPPVVPDPGIAYLHDRLNYLESQINELRSVILTKDGYVDRRNREDQHIRREFEAQKSTIERIEADLAALKTEVILIKRTLATLCHETALLRKDVTCLQKDVGCLQKDVACLQKDVVKLQVEVQLLKSEIGDCRLEIKHLTQRFDTMEIRMKQAEQVRYNSLAVMPNAPNAPIGPVPKVGENGTLRYPDFFPSTVLRFWVLKRRNHVHRLVKLAEFYELEGYQTWDRNHADDLPFDDDDFSDFGDEQPNGLTRAEAAYQYPEACHQALAATLGLNYRKILKVAREGSYPRAPKRLLDDFAPNHGGLAITDKPLKSAKLHQMSDSFRERLLRPQEEGSVSEPTTVDNRDYIYYRQPGRGESDISSRTKAKLKARDFEGLSEQDILRGIELGWCKVQDELPRVTKTPEAETKAAAAAPAPAEDAAEPADTVPMDEDAASRRTISTEAISPSASRVPSRTPSPPFTASMTSDMS
ncbi:hypothetical protein UA08_07141 [Talaromyces atroroseus]|uniref:Uncharacterized protein n=1 Tax=Talaromyces atroroseus TaxID=1441469 RepID=A0A225AQ98_TALAT|nr:hypothetical protein UA08_07141 [Talaromyces atroroseus]OKL57779.1 hypothetical protein UA08_07141 [Talaromyces atroroseus]